MAMRVMRQRLQHRQILEHGMRSPLRRHSNTRSLQPQARLQATSPVTAAVSAGCCSVVRSSAAACTGNLPSCASATAKNRRSRCRSFALPPMAMINVDFASPSLVLGIALIGCGVALLQVRNMQREVSRDADIVVAAMISIVGSTLIFQGWRLDPLLLLCQALTTSVAFWYGLETFKLRSQVIEEEEDAGLPPQLPPLEGYSNQMNNSGNDSFTTATRTGYLPPATDRPLPPWQQQQQQQQQPGQAQGSSRWGLPPADPGMQLDYYASPAAYAEQQQQLLRQQGLGEYMAQQLPPFQQQQQAGSGLSSSSSTYPPSGYGGPAAVGGMYGQEAQQQYSMLPQLEPPAQQWYDARPVNTAQGLYEQQQQLPGNGMAGQQQYGPANSLAARLLPDGSSYEATGIEGAAVPLPLGAGQQQRRAPTVSSGSSQAYERVDDWE